MSQLAEAIRHFCAVRDRSDEAAIKAAEIKLRAARRVGEILGPKTQRGGKPDRGSNITQGYIALEPMQIHRFRKLAAVEADVFEEHIAGKVGSGEQSRSSSGRLGGSGSSSGTQRREGGERKLSSRSTA